MWRPRSKDVSDGDTTDQTILCGIAPEMSRDPRLMRLQMDSLESRLAGHDGSFSTIDGRLSGIDGRIGALEQSFHDLANEASRSFSQMQQKLMHNEKRLESLDAGLAAIHKELASWAETLAAILAAVTPPVP
jgi:hypothetical protein